ncbi:hypothetical protein SAMN05192570_0893 [Brevundimonas viscosa]|uniref:Uncharacterized protein n=1 Tax=Brevundimonas viscosa TaxID=871741 RepID=A0A1I6P738_9CAUL|nr:hypothetical protein SAMN05192570_0893 [Brevundimonas viscosa]
MRQGPRSGPRALLQAILSGEDKRATPGGTGDTGVTADMAHAGQAGLTMARTRSPRRARA